MLLKRLLLIGFVAAVIGGAVGVYLWNKPVKDIQNAKTDFSMTAQELFTAYQSNEAAADSLYRRAVIEVTGSIIEVKEEQKEVDGEERTITNVVLDGGDMMFGVICQMADSNRDVIAQLSAGDEVTIKGECSGMLMDVVLTRSYLIQK
jgi:tRNA(Ile2) C34 agmatinyltransferase TiaS